ncbi:NERD domain-containing protein [Sutcliffiella cohnii]
MAQLLKLQDYISRYETDIYRYSNQYIRFKKQQWNALQQAKEKLYTDPTLSEVLVEEQKETRLSNLWNNIKRKKDDVPFIEEKKSDNGELLIDYNYIIQNSRSENLEKKLFLDALYPYQLRWASSTIREMSFLNKEYKHDPLLKYFLQRFPDTYFLMYHPIIIAKQAPVQLEHIFITPTEIICMTVLEEGEGYVYLGENGRFWKLRDGQSERKIVNPLISLNRMFNIVQNIKDHYTIEIPIKKVVLCKDGYIDFADKPSDVEWIDKRSYEDWFTKMRKNTLSMKHTQLKIATKLLQHCQSTFVERPEWK